MNREIKFRAWDVRNKVMIPNAIVATHNQSLLTTTLDLKDSFAHFDGVVWMQFIGRKDKANKDIYEGDLVKLNGKSLYEVYWDKDNCGWSLIHAKREGDKYGVYTHNIALNDSKEVIGNIYENPDLTKQ